MFSVCVLGYVLSEDLIARGKVHELIRIPCALHVPSNEDTLPAARLELVFTLRNLQVPDRANVEESLHIWCHPAPFLMR